jgi:hypothetical protein
MELRSRSSASVRLSMSLSYHGRSDSSHLDDSERNATSLTALRFGVKLFLQFGSTVEFAPRGRREWQTSQKQPLFS